MSQRFNMANTSPAAYKAMLGLEAYMQTSF